MKNFAFIFYTVQPKDADEAKKEGEIWMKWFDEIKDHVENMGSPFGDSRAVTADDVKTIPAEMWPATGYTVIKAENMDAATEIAKGCPGLKGENAVRVYELMPM